MKLALRTGPAVDATFMHRLASDVIKARLVTDYPHAGIVIGDLLYHASAKGGLQCVPYTPERWELIELGDDFDADALESFEKYQGAGYDWVSLLAFAFISARDSKRFYCYEWCYLAMTGKNPTSRVTPETLLKLALDMR
ncbi:MAG: hypothetical protein WC829_03055 [Hyphomicrobium sp.]|jgi:hypothetical protein